MRWLLLLVAFLSAEVAIARDEPSVRVTWVEVPPVLDGRLDDEAWADAPIIDRFRQAFPDELEPASQETEVRIVTDGKRLVDVGVELSQDDKTAFRGTFKFAVLDQRGAERLMGRDLPDAWKRFCRPA